MSLTKIGSIGINTGIKFSGLTTITTLNTSIDTLSIGGPVSIAGTLTYEDVTNVDAVGLITARAGVNVGSGITLSKDGDVFFTGIATGNGSGLTNLPAANITGTLPAISGANLTNLDASDLASGTVPTARLGSGTASSSTFLRGDSTFAAVTSTTINNNADNRLITGSGTANTLEGEANLTYNGGTTFTQTLNDNTAYSATATPQRGFQAHNQSDTTNSFSALRLTAGTSNPATAQISSLYTGAGQNDLTFQLETSNTAFEALRITSAGKMGLGTNNPTQYFHVVGNSASIQTEESGGGIVRMQSGGSTGNIGMYSNHDLLLRTNSLERLRINSSGNLKIGNTANRDLGGLSVQRLHIEGTDGGSSAIGLVNNQNSTGQAAIYFSKSRGTSVGSNTILQNNDPMGSLVFCGADGNDMISIGAQIKAEVDEAPGSNDMPGRLVFATTADGAATPTDRMVINKDGVVTKPNTPMFKVNYGGGAVTIAAGDVVFGTVMNNVGGYYNSSNGRFTAPVTGVYLFYVGWYVQSHSNHRMALRINGSEQTKPYISGYSTTNASGTVNPSASQFLLLSKDDYVTVWSDTAFTPYGVHFGFGGVLLG